MNYEEQAAMEKNLAEMREKILSGATASVSTDSPSAEVNNQTQDVSADTSNQDNQSTSAEDAQVETTAETQVESTQTTQEVETTESKPETEEKPSIKSSKELAKDFQRLQKAQAKLKTDQEAIAKAERDAQAALLEAKRVREEAEEAILTGKTKSQASTVLQNEAKAWKMAVQNGGYKYVDQTGTEIFLSKDKCLELAQQAEYEANLAANTEKEIVSKKQQKQLEQVYNEAIEATEKDFPELKDKQSALFLKAKELANDPRFWTKDNVGNPISLVNATPQGYRIIAEYADAIMKRDSVPSLLSQVEQLQKQLDEIKSSKQGYTGGGTKPPASGKATDNMSIEEQHKHFLSLAKSGQFSPRLLGKK